jgi:DNA-binding NarL/FixJ family response regulator
VAAQASRDECGARGIIGALLSRWPPPLRRHAAAESTSRLPAVPDRYQAPLVDPLAAAASAADVPAECDVLVLDINLPGRSGLDVLHALKEEGSTLRVLVVSMYPEDQYAIRALRAGAYGYVNKGGDPALIVAAVRTVSQGRKYVTPEIAQMLVESLTTPSSEMAHQKLSDRELQTLVMIASGKRLSDIADELMLSPKTVSVYRARVLEKLALSNNSEMTVYAIRNGLVGGEAG